jgi:transposase
LRQGLVWENSAWTGAHEAWLRAQRFDRVGVQLAFDEAFDAVLSVHARRDRLDAVGAHVIPQVELVVAHGIT